MSATDELNALKQKFETWEGDVKTALETHLPAIEETVTAAESNPLVQAVAAAAHLSAAPEVLQGLASVLGIIDNALGNAHAQGASEAAAPVPADAAEAPAPAEAATGPAAG